MKDFVARAVSTSDDAELPGVPGMVMSLGAMLTIFGFFVCGYGARPLVWVELGWALAFYAVGLFIGLLFSVAKIIENTSVTADTARFRYAPNQSLEQIADWLTKILVGVSLVELQKIQTGAKEIASVVAASIGGSAAVQGVAYATIIFFPVMGFLAMYFSMRLYLNRNLRNADEGGFFPPSVSAALDNPQTSLKEPNLGVTGPTRNVAADIAAVPLEKLSEPDDIIAWSRAQSIRGSWDDAVRGYTKAVVQRPSDPKLRLDYAVALYSADAPINDVVAQLKRGLELADAAADPDLASRLRQNLIAAYLYQPPPEGFSNAIRAIDDLLGSGLPLRAIVWYYRACAFGQKYQYLKGQNAPAQELDEARTEVMNSTRKALELDPSLVSRVRMISDPKYPDKSKRDTDLEAFFNDPDFRKLVWDSDMPRKAGDG